MTSSRIAASIVSTTIFLLALAIGALVGGLTNTGPAAHATPDSTPASAPMIKGCAMACGTVGAGNAPQAPGFTESAPTVGGGNR